MPKMRIVVENGLPDILTRRRVPSASAFARALKPHLGKKLSTSQITRYMRDSPPMFDLKFIGAACNVLRCLPTDLYRIRIECGPDEDLTDFGPLPRGVEVVRTPPDPASTTHPVPSEESARKPSAQRKPSGEAKRLNEGRAEVEESIHTGPKADVFPFRRK